MLSVQVVLLATLVYLVSSLPVRDEDEVGSFLSRVRHMDAPFLDPLDALLEARLRQLLSAGPDRRRQLGDLEFSNRYAEFLRSRAKHSSICAFLQRMQGFKKSGAGGNTERVNLLLKQYMCPSDWPSDL
ncbi:hypothetical protein fugu_011668 [Takifugu bimaculatus]|uniref:Uncharacterized protein n=2 Tax=Takifugu TaxID=31032 RepID=A0A5C6PBZ8_9TELE|nr:hypothetical protein fugu_011668 [Takifugu bimaculatus]TWW75760.1 hypothetical protein D4764_13G0004220 [Takifugu flavidus]